jgi:hypothetical protein
MEFRVRDVQTVLLIHYDLYAKYINKTQKRQGLKRLNIMGVLFTL